MNKLIPTNTKREDCVQTPINYCRIIAKHFNPQGEVLEPCCGDGNFLSNGVFIYADAYDLKDGKDFFNENRHFDWIITNPPYSKMRKFIQKAMEVSDNVVFLTSINHLWLKARLRDIELKGFGIREIVIFDTPKSFPQSGFQFGCFHLQKSYKGDIKFKKLEVKVAVETKTEVLRHSSQD